MGLELLLPLLYLWNILEPPPIDMPTSGDAHKTKIFISKMTSSTTDAAMVNNDEFSTSTPMSTKREMDIKLASTTITSAKVVVSTSPSITTTAKYSSAPVTSAASIMKNISFGSGIFSTTEVPTVTGVSSTTEISTIRGVPITKDVSIILEAPSTTESSTKAGESSATEVSTTFTTPITGEASDNIPEETSATNIPTTTEAFTTTDDSTMALEMLESLVTVNETTKDILDDII